MVKYGKILIKVYWVEVWLWVGRWW